MTAENGAVLRSDRHSALVAQRKAAAVEDAAVQHEPLVPGSKRDERAPVLRILRHKAAGKRLTLAIEVIELNLRIR